MYFGYGFHHSEASQQPPETTVLKEMGSFGSTSAYESDSEPELDQTTSEKGVLIGRG